VAGTTTAGDIPSSFGPFPRTNTLGYVSFFQGILPYIEQGTQVSSTTKVTPAAPNVPIKTFIAPADPYNPGTDGTISYASNGTLLGWADTDPTKPAGYPAAGGPNSYTSNAATGTAVNGSPTPRFPSSLGGRTSGMIIIAERSGRGGSKWYQGQGDPNAAAPFPTAAILTGSETPVSWVCEMGGANVNGGAASTSQPTFGSIGGWPTTAPSGAAGSPGKPVVGAQWTALSTSGCIVGMGDGSSRTVTQGNANAAWAWAVQPNDVSPQPSGW